MKPVFQTILNGYVDGNNGNCMVAAVASLLECSIDDMPRWNEMPDPEYWHHFIQWLWENGYELRVTKEQPDVPFYIGNVLCGSMGHSTVWSGGRMVHNPWPGAGTEGPWHVEDYWHLVPAEWTTRQAA